MFERWLIRNTTVDWGEIAERPCSSEYPSRTRYSERARARASQ